MIYVVGDLHGDLSKIKKLHDDKKLSKSDTVILLGDTGLSSTYEMFATSLKNCLRLSQQIFSASEETLMH